MWAKLKELIEKKPTITSPKTSPRASSSSTDSGLGSRGSSVSYGAPQPPPRLSLSQPKYEIPVNLAKSNNPRMTEFGTYGPFRPTAASRVYEPNLVIKTGEKIKTLGQYLRKGKASAGTPIQLKIKGTKSSYVGGYYKRKNNNNKKNKNNNIKNIHSTIKNNSMRSSSRKSKKMDK